MRWQAQQEEGSAVVASRPADKFGRSQVRGRGRTSVTLSGTRWLHGNAQPQTEDALGRAGTVLRRGDDSQIKQMPLADLHRWVYSFGLSEWDDPFGASTRHVSHPRR